MISSNRQPRNTIPATALNNYRGGSYAANFSGGGTSSPGNSNPIDYDQILNWPDVENEVIKSDGSSGPVEFSEVNWPGSASEVVRGDGTYGPIDSDSIDLEGAAWQSLNAELQKLQVIIPSALVNSGNAWLLYRVVFGNIITSTNYTPSNASPSTDSYGVAVSRSTDQTGAWWSYRLAYTTVGSMPIAHSPDVYIFPQDFNFPSTPPGEFFAAVRAGSDWQTRFDSLNFNLCTFGRVGSNWVVRLHEKTSATALGSVSSQELADSIVTSVKIANLAVTTDKIANAAVTNAKLGDGSVSTVKIQDVAVTNAKIANATITEGKLAFDWQLLKSVTEINTSIDAGFVARASSNVAIPYRNLVLQPRFSGALQTAPADGSAANGNIRGDYAADLQLLRDDAVYVAGGRASAILGGFNNEVNPSAPYSVVVAGTRAELLTQHVFAHGHWAAGFNRHSYVHGYNAHYQTVRVPLSIDVGSFATTSDGWIIIPPYDAPSGEAGIKINRAAARLEDPGDTIVYARIFWLGRGTDATIFADSIAIDRNTVASERFWAQCGLARIGGAGASRTFQCDARIRFVDFDTFQVEIEAQYNWPLEVPENYSGPGGGYVDFTVCNFGTKPAIPR